MSKTLELMSTHKPHERTTQNISCWLATGKGAAFATGKGAAMPRLVF